MRFSLPPKSYYLKFFSILSTFFILTSFAYAQVKVKGYYRKDGTYVKPHYRSSPNHTVRDNYSYKGNTNPYTGKEGTNYYRDDPTSEYYRGTDRSFSNRRNLAIPENASLNIYGNGWVCNRGYYRDRNRCLKIRIPRNASLDFDGDGWTCNRGYIKQKNACIEDTARAYNN